MANRIRNITGAIIHQLWTDGGPDKAALAALRSSSNLLNRNATTIWPLMLANLEEGDLSATGQPTYVEKAVYTALRCFALCQQGNDDLTYAPAGKDKEGKTLFAALQQLRQDDATSTAIDRRVQIVLGNSNFESTINAIYHLVTILKGRFPHEEIDFAQLGQDFYFFQLNSEMARQICLKWGQQYYRISKDKDNQKGEK